MSKVSNKCNDVTSSPKPSNRNNQTLTMDIGEVRVAEDKDFEQLKKLIDLEDGWKLEYRKRMTQVWTKSTQQTNLKIIKLKTEFTNVSPALLFDVLLDPDYRKMWDTHVVESYDIGCLNPNNDLGYYAVKCPSPLKNRDFVLLRSWLATRNEHMLINHSVYHDSVPPKKGFVRGISLLTGFVIRPTKNGGSELNYVTQCDPKGNLPIWMVNKLTQIFAPKMVKRLHKACIGYDSWKRKNNPNVKPWINPEQMILPRIDLTHCIRNELQRSTESLDESNLVEGCEKEDFSDDDES